MDRYQLPAGASGVSGLPAGATPLDGDELEGLIPTHRVNRGQLNVWEQQNIESAQLWLMEQRRPRPLDEAWLRELHQRMSEQTWRWAGQYRRSDKSIGADWRHVRQMLPTLLGDIGFQIEHRVATADEIAIAFHPRLVAIHPFPKGHGRPSRLIADVLVEQLGGSPFTWGGRRSLVDTTVLRTAYIEALRSADRGALGPRLTFARQA